MNTHSFTYCIGPIFYLCKIVSLAPLSFRDSNNTMKEFLCGVPVCVFMLACARAVVIYLFNSDAYLEGLSQMSVRFIMLLSNVIYLCIVSYNCYIRNMINHIIRDILKLENKYCIIFKRKKYFIIQIIVFISVFTTGLFDTCIYYKYIENLSFFVFSGFTFPMYINILYITLICLFVNSSKDIFTKLNGELIKILHCKNDNLKMFMDKLFQLFNMYCDASEIAQRQNSLFGAPTALFIMYVFVCCFLQNYFIMKELIVGILNDTYNLDYLLNNIIWFYILIIFFVYNTQCWNSTEKEVRLQKIKFVDYSLSEDRMPLMI